MSFRVYGQEAESRPSTAHEIAFEDLAIVHESGSACLCQCVPPSVVYASRLPGAFQEKDEASFSGSKSHYVCHACPSLETIDQGPASSAFLRQPWKTNRDALARIGVIPNGEPAALLIEEEQITYPFRLLRRSRSGLFPVPPSIDGSEHQEGPFRRYRRSIHCWALGTPYDR